MRAEQMTPPCAHLGEGPVWWPAWNGLVWLDIHAGDVLHLDAAHVLSRLHIDDTVGCIRPTSAGGAIVAGARSLHVLDSGGELVHRTSELWSDPTLRFNDGGTDPQGRFWCGTASVSGESRRAALICFGSVEQHPVRSGLTVSNGLAWSDDGRSLFHADTPRGQIDRFEYDPLAAGDEPATLGQPTVFARISNPDGLCVDIEGGVWVASWGAGTVTRFAPDGTADAVITFPTPLVTACTFGGPDLRTLFVTTARTDGTGNDVGGAGGALYAVATTTRGGTGHSDLYPANCECDGDGDSDSDRSTMLIQRDKTPRIPAPAEATHPPWQPQPARVASPGLRRKGVV